MWIASKHGFYSIAAAHLVQGKPENAHPDLMMIRARKHSHLVNLREHVEELRHEEIHSNKGTDYPYRIIAKRKQVMAAIATLADDIQYTNFKNEVGRTEPYDNTYLQFLHNVWSIALRLTPNRVASKLGGYYGDVLL